LSGFAGNQRKPITTSFNEAMWRQRQHWQRENLVYEKSYKKRNAKQKACLTETGLLMEGNSASLRFFFVYTPLVPRSRKFDLEKILAALNVTCPQCKASVPPDKQVRVDFEHQRCPGCGQTFVPNLYGVA
jgi:ribosomal protein S27AE